MLPKRVIPCLDVDAGRVVKGTEFVDIQDVGDPVALAKQYEAQGADELVFLDITATSEQRSPMTEVIRQTAANVFIPLTVGGGIRSEVDAQRLLDAGADKVAVNSAVLAEPALLDRLAARFGRQCVVLAVDAKRDVQGGWEVYAKAGKVATGREVSGWAQEAVRRGAGEILLTSIDQDGTNSGYDLKLIEKLTRTLTVPVIASGGAGQLVHYEQAIQSAGAEAVLAASQLHSGQTNIAAIKAYLANSGIAVRPLAAQGEKLTQAGGIARIAIMDYGVGNRRSVQQALQAVGAAAEVTANSDELAAADGIVLPGVGAFQPAMDRLRETGLDKDLQRLAALGKPILGICLGKQLLFQGSEENCWCEGLGLIPGRVQEIEIPIKPNIGWREVRFEQFNGLAAGLTRNNYFYHVHQYAGVPANQHMIVGRTRLPKAADPGYQIPTVVRHQNVYGVQFHPEKSSHSGARLLRNFVEICSGSEAGL